MDKTLPEPLTRDGTYTFDYRTLTFGGQGFAQLMNDLLPMASMVEQCQMPTNVIVPTDIFWGQSILNTIMYVIVTIFIIVLYTAIVSFIGYKFGFQNGFLNGQRSVPIQPSAPLEKVTNDKMTMTCVTYTYVRKMKQLRFEFNPNFEGCWSF